MVHLKKIFLSTLVLSLSQFGIAHPPSHDCKVARGIVSQDVQVTPQEVR